MASAGKTAFWNGVALSLFIKEILGSVFSESHKKCR